MRIVPLLLDCEFVRFAEREGDHPLDRIVLMSLFAGLINGFLIMLTIGAVRHIAPAELNLWYLCLFVFSALMLAWARWRFCSMASQLGETIVTKLRVRIVEKIRRSDLRLYEQIGRSPIFTALSKDINEISMAGMRLADALSMTVMAVCGFVYIAFLSQTAFYLVVGVLVLSTVIYFARTQVYQAELSKAFAVENEFYTQLSHWLDGFKETKINYNRSVDLFDHYFLPACRTAQDTRLKASLLYAQLNVMPTYFLYGLLLLVIFLLPSLQSTDSATAIAICSTVLFIFSPIGSIVESVPQLIRAEVAIRNMRKVEDLLNVAVNGAAGELPAPRRVESFQTVGCRELVFAYRGAQQDEVFRVGPVDLAVQRGEILFIIGGNGSGKSTLFNLLAGLYYPDAGALMLDGQPVPRADYPTYRNLFSAVFTDFHLFDRLYGLGEPSPVEVSRLLAMMQLNGKTALVDGRFTHLDLSTGQKRRLALLVSCLENKPVLLFDEMAADQDPVFRRFFYETLLQDLKAAGKTVIAITHDDAYFHCADRVVRMEYGQIKERIDNPRRRNP